LLSWLAALGETLTDRELRTRLEAAQARTAVAQRQLGEQHLDEGLAELRRTLVTLTEQEAELERALMSNRELVAVHVANRHSLASRTRAAKASNLAARLVLLAVTVTFLGVGLIGSFFLGPLLEGAPPWTEALVSAVIAGVCGWRLGRMQ
jgi:hypothetical protein